MESSLTAKIDTGLASLSYCDANVREMGTLKCFVGANGAEGTADSIRPSQQRTRCVPIDILFKINS
jgi:hypothetical protein